MSGWTAVKGSKSGQGKVYDYKLCRVERKERESRGMEGEELGPAQCLQIKRVKAKVAWRPGGWWYRGPPWTGLSQTEICSKE